MKYLINHIQIACLLGWMLLNVSCKNNLSIKKEDYLGKEIVFPDSLYLIKKDTFVLMDQSFYNSNNIRVVSIVKGDCGKCIDEVNELNVFLKELNGDFECFFIINTSSRKYFMSHVYPGLDKSSNLIYNKNYSFEKINKLEGIYNLFNTFIINSQNEIMFIGNPLYSKYNKNEYVNIISLQHEQD